MLTFIRFALLLLSRPRVSAKLITYKRAKAMLRLLLKHPGDLNHVYKRYSYAIQRPHLSVETILASSPEYIADVVMFGVIDWDYRYQRPQHFASGLAARGYRVFYISPVPLMGIADKDYMINSNPRENVFVVRLSFGRIGFFDPYHDGLNRAEQMRIDGGLGSLLADFHISSPGAIVQHPMWAKTVTHRVWGVVLYDCLDRHAAFFADCRAELLPSERELINSADVVTASSCPLRDELEGFRPVTLIRNGCEYSRFSAIARRKSGSPVLGYVGAISSWFDVELVAHVARLRPRWRVVLVGEVNDLDTSALIGLDNVEFVGEVGYEEVPWYMASFDVGLIPFKINALTEATNPVKVYEYLAVGCPVVATELPELSRLDCVDVFVAHDAGDFMSKVDHALRISDLCDRVRVRRKWAEANSWDRRVSELAKLLRSPLVE